MIEADCLFCKILRKEIPAEIVHEDEDVLGFKDLNPQAPTHELFIPRIHIATVNDVDPDGGPLLGRLMVVARQRAAALGIDAAGYRLVMNCGTDGGQAVFHIHLHLLGGRTLGWPPG